MMATTDHGGSNHKEVFLNKHPKFIIILMFLILIAGLVLTLIKRHQDSPDQIPEDYFPGQGFYYGVETVIDSVKSRPGMSDIMQILDLERELNSLMAKDTLSRNDSLFIKDLDKKLNKIIDEQH